MATRLPLAIVSLILLAGGLVMLWLVVLAGTRNASPLNQIWFLEADTSAIKTAPALSHWTLYNSCPVDANGNNNCGSTSAAYPFQPQTNFGTDKGVPGPFLSDPNTYYYLSRFAFAFYIIALFFAISAFFAGFLALCARLGAAITSACTCTAAFFMATAASLMTAWVVLARNTFQATGANGTYASIGVKAMAFSWAAVACFGIAAMLFCVTCMAGRKESRTSGTTTGATGKRHGRFSRKRTERTTAMRESNGFSKV